jgi:CMP-N-acetylneuraminic acid synthetase
MNRENSIDIDEDIDFQLAKIILDKKWYNTLNY